MSASGGQGLDVNIVPVGPGSNVAFVYDAYSIPDQVSLWCASADKPMALYQTSLPLTYMPPAHTSTAVLLTPARCCFFIPPLATVAIPAGAAKTTHTYLHRQTLIAHVWIQTRLMG